MDNKAEQGSKRAFRNVADLFKSTEPPQAEERVAAPADEAPSIKLVLPTERLEAFSQHPFKLYEGQRLADMVRSVSELGVLVPIVVRPHPQRQDRYEILSGHNRVNAARLAGLPEIPGVIRTGLSDEEAALIVTETNLVQRSFGDLSHSERAITLKRHLDALKSQGKRNDLLQEIQTLSESMEKDTNLCRENDWDSKVESTSGQVGEKKESREIVAENYNLSARNVSRYMQLNQLNSSLLQRVDADELSFLAGVALSYLPEHQQTMLVSALEEGSYKVDMKKAESLRALSAAGRLTPTSIVQVLMGEGVRKSSAKPTYTVKFKAGLYERFFSPSAKPREVMDVMERALEIYFEEYAKPEEGSEPEEAEGAQDWEV